MVKSILTILLIFNLFVCIICPFGKKLASFKKTNSNASSYSSSYDDEVDKTSLISNPQVHYDHSYYLDEVDKTNYNSEGENNYDDEVDKNDDEVEKTFAEKKLECEKCMEAAGFLERNGRNYENAKNWKQFTNSINFENFDPMVQDFANKCKAKELDKKCNTPSKYCTCYASEK